MDFSLTDDQRAVLLRRSAMYDGRWKGAAANAEKGRARRREYQREGARRAMTASPAYAAGCMLFWAEGDKCRNSVRISNSDPTLLAYFVDFLRNEFQVRDDKIVVACNVFEDHVERLREVEGFWLRTLGLPPTSLRKSVVNRYSKYSQKKRQNLPYGTCRVAVHSTEIVQMLYGSIQQLGGFEREEWLDLR